MRKIAMVVSMLCLGMVATSSTAMMDGNTGEQMGKERFWDIVKTYNEQAKKDELWKKMERKQAIEREEKKKKKIEKCKIDERNKELEVLDLVVAETNCNNATNMDIGKDDARALPTAGEHIRETHGQNENSGVFTTTTTMTSSEYKSEMFECLMTEAKNEGTSSAGGIKNEENYSASTTTTTTTAAEIKNRIDYNTVTFAYLTIRVNR
ncbi:MAG: hypothetical protein LBJ13_01490 [Puniceicoccales bacterium]|jgi:hypothetical protein|nr:hypothetical protein [Puniceicoccales bacterium]